MKSLPALIVVLAVLPVYVLRLDGAAGMMGDDAWYVMLAKALAEGQGYQLMNSPVAGILPGYPPGFPALLSLVFQIRPSFPENVWLLKSISMVAMFGVAWLTYFYLHEQRQLPRHLSACAAAAVATTPALVFLATSTVMSECVFTLAQLAAVVVAHRAVSGSPEHEWRWLVLAALFAAAAVLIRSAGIAVASAVFLFLIRQHLWQRAAGFATVVALCLVPWFGYARAHRPTPAHQEIHRGSIVYGYADQFWMRWAGSPSSGRITTAEISDRVARNTIDVFGRSIGGVFAASMLRGPEESGEEVLSLGGNVGWTFVGMGTPVNLLLSFTLSAIVVWGFFRTARQKATVAEYVVLISLALTLVWPFYTFRFVLPLAPFLYFYLVQGIRVNLPVVRIVLLTVVGLNLYDHAGYVLSVRSNPERVDWIARFAEVDSTLTWMRSHLDRDATVAATNPALVHLRTGHKTITLDTLTESWDMWRSRGARYLACLVPRELPSRARGPYTVLYEASDAPSRAWVIEID